MAQNFSEEIILENDRALLTPLNKSHYPALLDFSVNEPNLWQYSVTPASGHDQMTAYLNKALELRSAKDSYPFVVFDKLKNSIAGSTRFYDFNAHHLSVQLGYTWYGQKYQGTGLNKNCKFLLLEFAFENLKLERVEFRADKNNERSIAAMKSIGCTVEGILRSNYTLEKGRRDSIVLSILRSEWEDRVREVLWGKC